jgi:hypothetical protein
MCGTRSGIGHGGIGVPVGLALFLALPACESPGSLAPLATGPSPSTSSTTAVISPSAPPMPMVSRHLGTPPTHCGRPAPRPRKVVPLYGPLVGERPVWVGVYASLDVERAAYHAEDATRTHFGWRVKFLWVLGPSATAVVRLTGANVRTGDSIWFEVSDGGDPTPTGTLDPATPGAVSEPGSPWREFPSYLHFPSAGCYLLQVDSGAAGWNLRFGFGR